ncbi:MAG: hypothetical protein ACC628_25650, partial [Pirellulaceae bacterium]
MNEIEEGYRSMEMQSQLVRKPEVFDAILRKCVWENKGQVPLPLQRKNLWIGRTRYHNADEVRRMSLQPARFGRGFSVEFYGTPLESFRAREMGDTIAGVGGRDG